MGSNLMTEPCRVVFLGTPDFAVPVLEALVQAGYTIPFVITQPDKPTGRKQRLTPPPVKEAAVRLGLTVRQPVKVREAMEDIAAARPDILLTAAYGQILPQRLLDLARHGSLNVHASLLPRWRGAAPIHRAIMAGDEVSGVTLMEMVRELDAGPLISSVTVPIGPDDTVGTLHDNLAQAGAALLIDTLPDYLSGQLTAKPQPEEGVTYAERILPADERIDWNRTVKDVHNHVRGLSPWPVARTTWQGKPFKVWKTRRKPEDSLSIDVPGTVSVAHDGDVMVRCLDGWLCMEVVQPAGKRQMEAKHWMHGIQSDSTTFEDDCGK
jgi:methionyl-tRNA formyltransferase